MLEKRMSQELSTLNRFARLAFDLFRVYTLKCALGGFMEVSTKELRIQPGKIIDHVVNGQEVTVTFRGKALAKIVPLKEGNHLKMIKYRFLNVEGF